MHFPYLGENQELDETTRRTAPGSFVRLSDGITHYEISGPVDSPVVILVHGFSVPFFIFDPTFDFLAGAGYRVLRYDLFGRGWSDRPQLANNIGLFVRQLHDLVLGLELNTPAVVLGLSMGGPISAAFTVEYPQLVSANVLLDPAGVHPIPLGFLSVVSRPVLGEIVLGMFGGERLVKNIASDFFNPAQVEHFQARYRPQMRLAGFKRSILSTLRSGMLGDFSSTYHRLGSLGKPVLVIWGCEDSTVPFHHSSDLLKLVPQAEFHAIEQTSHIPHYEKPEQVNFLLQDFLQRIYPGR